MRDRSAKPAVPIAWLVLAAIAIAGCSRQDPVSASEPLPEQGVETARPSVPPTPAEPLAAPPPPSADAAAWTPAALDELLAPIALYPDPILAQVLAASTNPQEVLDAGNWLIGNPGIEGEALTRAVAELGFTPSVQSLVHFPTVVDMMCRELDWTRQLGDAFNASQPAVLDAVQRLRRQAKNAGNLVSTPEIKVDVEPATAPATAQSNGTSTEVVVIQPANPQVIYVPQYNPTQVYAPPPAAPAPAPSSGITTEQAVVGGLLAFTAGVLIADAFDDDDNYGYPNWGHGGVYYGGRPYYPHNTFVYAPNHAGYRPTPYYRPPANYQNSYRNQQNYRGGTTINVENNYYNRFDKNQNRVSAYQPRTPVSGTTAAQSQSWRGSSTYAGAQSPRPTQTPGRPATTGQSRTAGTYAGARTGTAQSARPTATSADRGYPKTSGKRPDAATASRQPAAFQGASNQQAHLDRSASQRGRSSMQSAPRPSTGQAMQRAPRGRG